MSENTDKLNMWRDYADPDKHRKQDSRSELSVRTGSDSESSTMKKTTRKTQNRKLTPDERFISGLDNSILFHRNNTNDPHNVGIAVICALTEVRECFAQSRGLK